MSRAVLILGPALLAATLGLAQGVSTSGAASNQTNPSVSGADATVRGCLSSSSLGDNHFTLTQDQTGTVYTLAGQTDQLQAQVGHQVEVTGQDISHSEAPQSDSPSATKPGSEGSESSQTGNHALKVTSVRMLVDHCQASSVNPPGTVPTAPTKVAEDTPPSTPALLRLLGFTGLSSLLASFVSRK